MKRTITLLAMVFGLCSLVQATTLYKIVGKDGKITYTDKPQQGAIEVKLAEINVVKPQVKVNANSQQKARKTIKRAIPNYQVKIQTPQSGATVRNATGDLFVTAQLSPQGAGEYHLLMDGKSVATSKNPSFKLNNVDRGEHKMQVKFVHRSGKAFTSQPHTVYLHRPSVINRAR